MNSKWYDGKSYEVRQINTLKELFTSSCKLFSDEVAYLQKDRVGGTFTPIKYKQVKDDVDALGTALLELGLENEKIAVIGETSYKWILSYFATVCGVGAIVPLDKNLPSIELKNLIVRSKAKALIYSKKMEPLVKPLLRELEDVKIVIAMAEGSKSEGIYAFDDLLERGRLLLKNGIDEYLEKNVVENQMAALIFTSGTTGTSKGVMLSQKNIAANVKNMSTRVNLPKGMVVLSILPIHHTYEMTCVIWTTFFQGRTIAICEGLKYIQKNLAEVKAGCLVGVPLVFEKMHKGIFRQAKQRNEDVKLRKAIDISRKLHLFNNQRLMKTLFKAIHNNLGGNMKLFIAGGAAIDPEVIKDFEAMGIAMIQGYGMSENAPIIAVNQDRYSIAESVGRPLPETEVIIDNPNDEGVGEVWCKGPSVMLGYYEDEEETSAVLTDGWLHTGDLGYLDERGFLYLTGRKKTVIVTKSGKNIYPEEVETVILAYCNHIAETLIFGISDENADNTIIACEIYPNYESLKDIGMGSASKEELLSYFDGIIDEINKSLPPYKRIKRVYVRDVEFDKTTTGKIKRFGNVLQANKDEKK